MRSVCMAVGCDREVHARGLCEPCYERGIRAGVITPGCAACTAGNGPLCRGCQPTVCVCAVPDPDAIGECRSCRRVYKPQHAGLMEARRVWIAYLTDRGVLPAVAERLAS